MFLLNGHAQFPCKLRSMNRNAFQLGLKIPNPLLSRMKVFTSQVSHSEMFKENLRKRCRINFLCPPSFKTLRVRAGGEPNSPAPRFADVRWATSSSSLSRRRSCSIWDGGTAGGRARHRSSESGQILQGSFSSVSKPIFASTYSFESSRRDLHNTLL